MSTTTPATTDQPAPEFLENSGFRRFSVDEYHQMIRAGILLDGEPIELLEGWMVKKMSHGTPHDSSMDAFEGLLPTLLPADWFVRCQRAITLSDSEPEPDYAVVRGPRSRYRNGHPTPPDIGLIVEFSVTSLRLDRVGKGRIYARAGIPVYWVVNVADKVIEVYTQPSGTGETAAYAKRDDYAIGTSVPVILDGSTAGTIAVVDVMG
jgi:Uma2 family endonuclease